MKISVDLDKMYEDAFSGSLSKVIEEEIQYAVRNQVRALIKDRKAIITKDIEKVMAKYLSNMPSAEDLIRLAQGPPRG